MIADTTIIRINPQNWHKKFVLNSQNLLLNKPYLFRIAPQKPENQTKPHLVTGLQPLLALSFAASILALVFSSSISLRVN